MVEVAALPDAADAKFKIPADAGIKNEAAALNGVGIVGEILRVRLTERGWWWQTCAEASRREPGRSNFQSSTFNVQR